MKNKIICIQMVISGDKPLFVRFIRHTEKEQQMGRHNMSNDYRIGNHYRWLETLLMLNGLRCHSLDVMCSYFYPEKIGTDGLPT